MTTYPKKLFTTALCTLIYAGLFAQTGNRSSLSIQQIMQGDGFVGHLPGENLKWSADSRTLYFDWNPDNALSDSLYGYHTDSKKIEKVDFESEWNIVPANATLSNDGSKKIYELHGDIYYTDLKKGKTWQVTNTTDYESGVHFTFNDTKIAYSREGNVFCWDPISGTTEQITNFDSGKKSEPKKSEKDEWLAKQQLELFDVLRERRHKKDVGDSLSKRSELKRPLSIQADGRVYGLQMSPDGNYVTYLTVKRGNNEGTKVPDFVTESGYVEDINARSKVGDSPSTYKMFVYDIRNRKVYPVSFDALDGIGDKPAYLADYPDNKYENKDRISNISGPRWSPDGKYAFIDINTNDYKDRWIALLDIKEGKVKTLDRQHNDAWIAGPGIGGWSGGDTGWMPDGKSIWFVSERSGYAHLYTLDVTTSRSTALTQGDFEIYDPVISKDKKRWYFSSNENHPGDRQFYTMALNGGKVQQLTTMTGNNSVALSPDEKYIAIRYSYLNKPWEIYLMKNPVNTGRAEKAEQITRSTTKEFENYQWREPEVISFKAEDGAEVYARLYQPESNIKNKAAVIFVHGAGYLQNAHKWWSSYFREYMFHNILADNGYTVLDIDYRGSAGYGADWRTGIYRHMGGKDLSDQVDGARMLIDQYGIDADKVGIYGGSYGGFITLMALFNEADTFKAGAALRSVTDWAHYNHGYTSRILNTPVNDPIAYQRSSPINFAEGLKGDLLMLHGMIDDNVQFQDIVRLSQRLIELGKEHWELAVFPVEKHGFVEPSSWTDEYTRIFYHFQKNLLNKAVKE